MISDVVRLAIGRAIEDLPFGAMGVRCHALPVDEELAACVDGINQLLSLPGYQHTKCVVGSASSLRATSPQVQVLQSDLAAAEATRLRNDVGESNREGFRLIYLNSGSTPGEAGLEDVLIEVRAQALARYFAETAGLALLAEAGRSRARSIVARLQDTNVATLAKYAAQSRAHGELYALPALGLLPRTLRQDSERPSPQWVNDFDTITSGKLIGPLVEGIEQLEALSPIERSRLTVALSKTEGVLPPGLSGSRDAVGDLIALAKSARGFALGQELDPGRLCGLNRRLLDVLRSPDAIVALAAEPKPEEGDGNGPDVDDDDDSDDDGGEGGPLAPLREEQILSEGGAVGLEGRLTKFDVDDDGTLGATLQRDGGPPVTVIPADIPASTFLSIKDFPELQEKGAALEISPEAAVLTGARPASVKARYELKGLEAAQHDLRQGIEQFLALRKQFIAAVGALLPGDEEERYSVSQRAVMALEAIPLISVANTKAAASQYVAAYVEVMGRAFSGTSHPSNDVEKWLTHLDIAFVADTHQDTVAARLQPVHPLRIARSLLWLEKRSEPPIFPSVFVTMTGYAANSLYPLGERYCYHARQTIGPGREGIVAAVEDGIGAVWSLLSPHNLMTAIDVELVDVVNAAAAVEALYRAAAERFAADATVGAGVHLRVRCTYSLAHGPTGISCPRIADLPELAGVAGALPGNGVTVEIMPKPLEAGADQVHLSVQAVEAPFHGLPPSTAVGWGEKYIPGQSGNIVAVELTGNLALDSYRRLLSAYQKNTTATFDPGLDDRGLGKALVKTLVASGGWPVKPSATDSLLSYDVISGHVVSTLVDGAVFDGEVARRLSEFSSSGGAEAATDLRALREGILGLYPCRHFLADLLSQKDPRHTLGWLGILRAFRDAQRGSEGITTLPLSLDSPEGRAWVRATAAVLGGDESRADLLVVEANLQTGVVERLRVVELKARTSARQLTSKKAREKLAAQALVTAARLRLTLGGEEFRAKVLRDSLRRFLWLGAGQQRAALLWKGALENLDAVLFNSDPIAVEVKAECWLVPEEAWVGDDDTEEEVQALDALGAIVPGLTERVRMRVLQAVSRREEEVRGDPSGGGPGDGNSGPSTKTTSSATSSAPQSVGPGVPVAPLDSVSPSPATMPVTAPTTAATPTTVTAQPSPNATPGLPQEQPSPRPNSILSPPGATRVDPSPSSPMPLPGHAPRPVLMPATSNMPSPDGLRVVFGQVLQGAKGDAVWLPNRTDLVTHFNVGITGTMGSGKTQFTKSLLTQIVRQGQHNPGGKRPGILVFDYKGDYVDAQPGGFAHAVGARVLQPHFLPINPLRLKPPESKLDLKLSMRQFAETIRTIATATGDVQRLGIIQAIEACLKDAGIDEDLPPTWNQPFPTIKDLHARLVATHSVEGVPFAVIHDLADFDIFSPQDPGLELDALFDDITVIDLRPLAGAETVIRAVISFFMNAFFARMIQQGESLRETRTLATGGRADVRQIRRLLLVDEADDFIGLDLPSLKNVMQQGRAFGYGVILSTQFLHHFDGANSPLKPLVGTWVLHRMADVGASSLRNLFGLSNDEAKALATTLSGLEVHTSVCFGLSNEASRRRLAKVRDLPFFELIAASS